MEEVDKEISEMKLFVGPPLSYGVETTADIRLVERKSTIRGRVILDTCKCYQPYFRPI